MSDNLLAAKVAPSTPSVKVNTAIAAAQNALNGTFDAERFPTPSLEYLANQDGSASLAYVFQVSNSKAGTWFETFVDAHTGKVTSVTDFRADASVCCQSQSMATCTLTCLQYNVVPFGKESVLDGLQTVVDPQDLTASPQGWHDDGNAATTNTA